MAQWLVEEAVMVRARELEWRAAEDARAAADAEVEQDMTMMRLEGLAAGMFGGSR